LFYLYFLGIEISNSYIYGLMEMKIEVFEMGSSKVNKLFFKLDVFIQYLGLALLVKLIKSIFGICE